MDIIRIQDQLDKNRRSVAFDSYDITVRQLFGMVLDEIIDVAPEYQRHFIWNEERQSQLIESLFLGIPVPSLFMATNTDSTWEVIDGLQRLTTIINFLGDEKLIKRINDKCHKLKIEGLEKLDAFNGYYYEDLPKTLQTSFLTRPVRVTVLNDRSDFNIRYDLFERLNTGGIKLHPQEIRNCIYIGNFSKFIKECAKNKDFIQVVKVSRNAELVGNLEELILKFFAYYEDRNLFNHSVKDFLNDYMAEKTKSFKNKNDLKKIFTKTFEVINQLLPDGIVRSKRKNTTPIVLFEAISIGVADAIQENIKINRKVLLELLDDEELAKLTTGATNSRSKLTKRIDFVKNTLANELQ